MGIGGGSSGSNEAALARKDEEERQARIRAGTERINSIFDGQTVGSGALGAGSAYDPNATYYLEDGSVWSPQAFSGFGASPTTLPNGRTSSGRAVEATPSRVRGGGANALSPEDQFAQMLASGKLYSGATKSGGFGDDFFSSRRKAFLDYASPQLEDQYAKAGRELTYALDRGGNLNSSVRGEKAGELQKLYDLNKQQIADQALSYETDTRNSVEDARAGLISTLNATGDAEGAAKSALARASALSQAPSYSALGQLFTDFTGTLGIQAAQEKAAAASGGSYTPKYNTGLFGNSGRVTVTG